MPTKPDTQLSADYLVVGTGAMGMAFTDVLMTETDATVVMVDRHHRPGGHWNDAYPYVRLHQPSSFYGVNSKVLGAGFKDETGWNSGLYELASGAEVCAYFDHVMQRQFLPSGRVQYFPSCTYDGDGRFTSTPSGSTYTVQARKTVDATYMNVSVPSMRPPPYSVAPGVRCVPLNELPREERPKSGYVVVGAGKTGMDACLWLLSNEVEPDDITWIMPRDSWLLDRANIQPGDLSEAAVVSIGSQTEAIANADSIPALFEAVSACGALLRLDENVVPTMYRCATVTQAELEQLRRIRNVVRKGRVKQIDSDEIVFEEGVLASDPGRLYVDCSADGLARRPIVPVFQGPQITLQAVRTCQQVFSAAFIGHVEAAYRDEAEKNELCTPIPHPNADIDFLRTTLAQNLSGIRWSRDAELTAWLSGARLDAFSQISAGAVPSAEVVEGGGKLARHAMGSIATLQRLLGEVDGSS